MSTRADSMRAVVAAIAPALKLAGFRKRRHVFTRRPGANVVQSIDFQMARYSVPPGSAVPPGLEAGSFTINLGVRLDNGEPDWACEYFVREGIGALLQREDREHRAVDPTSSSVDIWWSLADVELAADAAATALQRYGLPWLDELRTDPAVRDYFDGQSLA